MTTSPKKIRHTHYHFFYPTTPSKHYLFLIGTVSFIIVCLFFIFQFLNLPNTISLGQLSLTRLVIDGFATFSRLLIAYFLSLIIAIPLALLVISTPKIESVLLPFFDILQSIPVLAFFPFIVLVFIKLGMGEGAAIFILCIAMLWNIVFSTIGGLKSIPKEIYEAANIFEAKGFTKLTLITIPAIFPYLVTGSMLAWAQGWNIIIVAEVLHNYIPNGAPFQDLNGLGSILVNATYTGNNTLFLGALIVMILFIGTMNFAVWQKLLHYAERFKFE